MNEFFELYESLCRQFPLYMKLEHLRSGEQRWRLQVFGKNMARTTGDANITCIEAPTRQQAFEDSTKALRTRQTDLATMRGGYNQDGTEGR